MRAAFQFDGLWAGLIPARLEKFRQEAPLPDPAGAFSIEPRIPIPLLAFYFTPGRSFSADRTRGLGVN